MAPSNLRPWHLPLRQRPTATTTEEEDFITINHQYPTFNGEIMGVKYNPQDRVEILRRYR